VKKFSLSQIMNEQTKGEAQPGKAFNIELLPIGKLVPSQMNKYRVADVSELKASIEMMGLQQNLLVRAREDSDTYEIISGHRRYKAMSELYAEGNTDFASIPCKVLKSSDDAMAELQLLFGNSTARQISDYERTYQAERIRQLLYNLKASGFEFSGKMREIVADILDVSPAQVGKMESINKNLLPGFKEEFKAGKINVTTAWELSRLTSEQQARQLAEYKKAGAVEVKDVQQQRKRAKPQPADKQKPLPDESQPREPTPLPDVSTTDTRSKSVEPGTPSAAEIIRDLNAIAQDIESGKDGLSYDICGTCRAAAKLIKIFERGLD
jgi:ParB family transcriptional regulator, chromosome partitioning protein